MTTLSLSDKPAHEIAADALVLGAVSTDDGAALAAGHGLPRAAATHLASALKALQAKGTADEVLTLAGVPGVSASVVVLTGLGEGTTRTATFGAEVLRRSAGAALRGLRGRAKVVIALPAPGVEAVGAVAEGSALGVYAFVALTGKGKGAPGKGADKADKPTAVIVVTPAAKDRAARAVVKRAEILTRATCYARDLVNLPPNLIYPQSFVDSVKGQATTTAAKVTVKVLDEKALLKGGFGGIVGVGQGSAQPPRIATLSYTPAKPKASVALVGKGITFDSGGLCIKPPASMLTMKSDMAGAAAVAATVFAAAELGLPLAVTGFLCLAENMPSATAQRPGDVVTMRNGTTVEIIDTDAEGRMVLGDGLCLATELGPDAIVDIATLTGAQTVALGTRVAGIMANDDGFRDRVRDAAATAGEAAWPMPLPADLKKGMESQIADVAHKADRWGGMLTAGLFLQDFAGPNAAGEQIPWAHIDIAGPSFNESGPFGYTPKGGTGYGVATMLALLESYAG